MKRYQVTIGYDATFLFDKMEDAMSFFKLIDCGVKVNTTYRGNDEVYYSDHGGHTMRIVKVDKIYDSLEATREDEQG